MSTGRPDSDNVLRATDMSDLPALVALIERVSARTGLSAETRSELRLAAEEVFINIFRHGYRHACGPVTVTMASTPQAVTIKLTDAAPAFDPANLRLPDTASDWQARPVGGLGWYLVHQVMDEVHYTPGGHGGNVYTLVKNVQTRPTPDPLIS